MTKRSIVIATRESPLALCQTEWVKSQLQGLYPHLAIEILGITTQADKMLDISLTTIGGKGLFVKELESALLERRADIAVHSMKDVPMELPEGLAIPVICEREDPRDVFISDDFASLCTLPSNAIVGTASLRRQSQLRALRADLHIENLRGNINTRLQRLKEKKYAAIILAAAGMKRMDFTKRIRAYFSTDILLPAAGQGALGIECRSDDQNIIDLIAPINHVKTNQAVSAERALCRHINGGCMVPLAAFAQIKGGALTLEGLVASMDGRQILRVKEQGSPLQAVQIGTRAAEVLLQQGAEKILKAFR